MKNILNRIISLSIAGRYRLTEGLLLKLLRFKYENIYISESNPLVTCYVPTYNRSELLINRAVNSVLNQSYNNIELVVIGDRCTDNTTELINKINDNRIVYRNLRYKKKPFPETSENMWLAGEVIAANYALSISNGEWIARIDDDDEWTNNHVQNLLDFAYNNNFEFVSGNVEITTDTETIINKGPRLYSKYFNNEKNKISDNNNPRLSGHSTWLYRSYLKYFKYNPQCWRKEYNRVNDIDLALRFLKAGVRIGNLDETVSYLKPRPGEDDIGWAAVANK